MSRVLMKSDGKVVEVFLRLARKDGLVGSVQAFLICALSKSRVLGLWPLLVPVPASRSGPGEAIKALRMEGRRPQFVRGMTCGELKGLSGGGTAASRGEEEKRSQQDNFVASRHLRSLSQRAIGPDSVRAVARGARTRDMRRGPDSNRMV